MDVRMLAEPLFSLVLYSREPPFASRGSQRFDRESRWGIAPSSIQACGTVPVPLRPPGVKAISVENATDTSLMAAYVGGDRHAFESLFARLAPRVHGFFRRSFDATIADDLLQVTFLK